MGWTDGSPWKMRLEPWKPDFFPRRWAIQVVPETGRISDGCRWVGWYVYVIYSIIQFILVINQQSLDVFKDKSMGNRGFWHELCVDSFWTKSSGQNLGNNLQAEVLDQLPATFLEVLGDHQQEWPATEAVSWQSRKCWSRRSGLFKTV